MLKLIMLMTVTLCFAIEPNWAEGAKVPLGIQGRANIYQLSTDDLFRKVRAGLVHASQYPVDVTGARIPYQPLIRMLGNPQTKGLFPDLFKSFSGVEKWLGLAPYNRDDGGIGPYSTPKVSSLHPNHRLGTSVFDYNGIKNLSFSCTACHAYNLFGKTVVGLPNKRSRANRIFELGKAGMRTVGPNLFRVVSGANASETKEYRRTRQNLKAVGVATPLHLGLDTSLSHVGLSLSRREADAWATKNSKLERKPRPNALNYRPGDSKVGTWWIMKYKNKWLSDGSVVSGNPIFTNILWNEIGRGTDLKELAGWLDENTQIIEELTATVYAAKAPKWTEYFPLESIDLAAAKRGGVLFENNCSQCHGSYTKGWDLDPGADLSEQLATKDFEYFEDTPIIDVETDPYRYEGMRYFYRDLNRLEISKRSMTVVRPQKGYIPPPLEGIWARFPYLHNGSVPTLCDLLTPASDRTEEFYQGPSQDITRDYDADCVGYPVGASIPESWKKDRDAKVVTKGAGLSNQGHESMLYNSDGSLKFSSDEKRDLIEFLKTL